MDTDHTSFKGNLYVIAAAICFSLGGVLIKSITWSSFTINGIRNFLAFMVMAIYLKKINHKIVVNKIVLLGAIINIFMNLTFVMATKLTSAANAIVLHYTEPIFLILFLWLIWNHKPDKNAVITCTFVFIGILCFFIDKISVDGLIGNILAIISGILYAFIFLLKKMRNADFESSILLSQIFSFILFIPWYVKETEYSINNIILIVILGVAQMGIGYILLAKGLESVAPMTASLTSTIEPIVNPLLVAIFYGEMVTPMVVIGAAIVIIATTIYNIFNMKEEKAKVIE